MAQKVLIIDDDHEFVEATSNLLDAQGYKVDTAPNGKLGVAKAKENKPDIILLDVMMSSSTEGFEVARELNKDKKLQDVPVILITGVRREMSLPFGFEPDEAWLPVKGVLEKPVKPNVLLKTVAQCLGGNSKPA
ncbi:MAG: response regulator [Kiritimatiellia bacterium]